MLLEGEVGLEVVVRGPQDRWRGDATNVLGGIGDVLQRKQQRPGMVDLSHLGQLAGVALYHDDRQVRQVLYREERAPATSYVIRVWALPPVGPELLGPTRAGVTGDDDAAARGRQVLAMLAAKGAELGFSVQREYPVPGGRLDLVWLLPSTTAVPGLEGSLPVVGFEVESSWRTRKHLKGDWLNLHDLGAALGVIVLLGAGDDIDATRRFAQEVLATRPGSRVLVWSEADVEDYIGGSAAAAGLAAEAELPGASSAEGVAHTGKYRALWAWLREHPDQRLLVRFAELEELIGLPLPPSCRRHPAHWTSYQGSAVARAIQDAGWVVAKVEVEDEQIMLTRQETQTASASTIAPQS